MNTITKKEYLKYAIKNDYVIFISWVSSIIGIPLEATEYVKFDKTGYFVMVDNEYVSLIDSTVDGPPLNLNDEITIEPGYMVGVDESFTTTAGRIIFFYITVGYPFKGKIPFINKKYTLSYIEDNYIAKMLGKEISIEEYNNFVDACTYARSFSDIIGLSATKKSILPPPNIAEKRKEFIDEVVSKYGEKGLKDYSKIIEIENKLKAYDKEWLSDDPALGVVINDKTLNNARKKMFLMFGSEEGLKNPGEDAYLIPNSLEEGLPTDSKSISELNNSARAGSYSRAIETFKGGLMGKIMLRALNNTTIVSGDCGTKLTVSYKVDVFNYEGLTGRYIVKDGKTVLIENVETAKGFVGKVVNLRSMRMCNSPNESYCQVCSGVNMSETSIPIVTTDMAGTVLNDSMKKMHTASIEKTDFNIINLLT